jgi:hypothetical protein
VETPLTPFQENMYQKINKSMPTSRSLQLAVCRKLHGGFDLRVFERAAGFLASRHPILCARLDNEGAELKQGYGDGPPSFEIIDAGTEDEEVVAVLAARADESMDLFHENPLKIVVARPRSDVTFLLLVGHHIFFDEFSLERLLAEYVDLVVNPTHAEEASPASWDSGERSFFSWCSAQARMSRDGSFAKNERYWLEYLKGADPVIHLPGRPCDPDFQDLATLNFRLTPEETRASLNRAADLGVSHFSLVMSAVFHALCQETLQESITITIPHNARRRPFDRTIGQFAEAMLLKQGWRERVLTDQKIKLVYRDVIKGVKNYVSYAYFADQVPWISERRDKKFGATDVRATYLPWTSALDVAGKGEIFYVPLRGRMAPTRPAYYGVVISLFFRMIGNSIWGAVTFEPSLVDSELAQRIISSIRCELGREIPPGHGG